MTPPNLQDPKDMATLMSELAHQQMMNGQYFVICHPWNSAMFLQDDMTWLVNQKGVYTTRVDLSTYYRDPTIFVGQYCLMQKLEKIFSIQ